MNLVPTLEKLCAVSAASDFWRNHAKQQGLLDGQCYDPDDEPAMVDAGQLAAFLHRNVSDLHGRRVANSIVPKARL